MNVAQACMKNLRPTVKGDAEQISELLHFLVDDVVAEDGRVFLQMTMKQHL